ncbi:MAG: DUF4071 domain-containing protein [Planctomycetes bacterium]|nr:DUF4071 domain-containing protein [Planctomycetota bacterium]
MPRPIAFMVMAYGERPTGSTRPGAPGKVDFNRLWDEVYRPVLEQLDYTAVRADEDTGALIIKEMIERLALSDLVLADITLSNANVYYEVGVRHAARNKGCVLVAADWSQQPFDLDQIPNIRFPLQDGAVPAAEIDAIRAKLLAGIPALADGDSPVVQSVPGYPDKIDPKQATSFREFHDSMTAFQARIAALRAAPSSQRETKAREILAEYPPAEQKSAAVAVELLHLARDHVDWAAVLELIKGLPESLRRSPYMQEQLALAQSKSGDHAEAIAGLEALIKTAGGTSERYGLLGGRYKKLYRASADERDKGDYLERAIESYERGRDCDLNDYYPTCNLPGLYRDRDEPGDDARAAAAEVITMAACERAIASGSKDEWVRPTLLGLAFATGDVTKAQGLATEIKKSGAAAWQLATMIEDLDRSVARLTDDAKKAELGKVLASLRKLLPA